jgi:hypothetical protein
MVQELTLLKTRRSELCVEIVSPPTVLGHLSDEMQIATIRHIEMVGQLTSLRVAVLYQAIHARAPTQ